MSVSHILSPNGLVDKQYLPLATLSTNIFNQVVVPPDSLVGTFVAPRAGFYVVQLSILFSGAGSNPGTAGTNVLSFPQESFVSIALLPSVLTFDAVNTAVTMVYMTAGNNTITFTPATDFHTGVDGRLYCQVLGTLSPLL